MSGNLNDFCLLSTHSLQTCTLMLSRILSVFVNREFFTSFTNNFHSEKLSIAFLSGPVNYPGWSSNYLHFDSTVLFYCTKTINSSVVKDIYKIQRLTRTRIVHIQEILDRTGWNRRRKHIKLHLYTVKSWKILQEIRS